MLDRFRARALNERKRGADGSLPRARQPHRAGTLGRGRGVRRVAAPDRRRQTRRGPRARRSRLWRLKLRSKRSGAARCKSLRSHMTPISSTIGGDSLMAVGLFLEIEREPRREAPHHRDLRRADDRSAGRVDRERSHTRLSTSRTAQGRRRDGAAFHRPRRRRHGDRAFGSRPRAYDLARRLCDPGARPRRRRTAARIHPRHGGALYRRDPREAARGSVSRSAAIPSAD